MRRPYVLYPFIVVLVLLNAWMLYLLAHPPRELEVHFLDVGQGDAILIETPDGVDMLIDGGPDRSVVRQLPKELGIFDRKIDVVVATHPDKDHIAGLADVLEGYAVSYLIESGAVNDTPFSEALSDAAMEEPGLVRITARRGMRIRLGEYAYADVLFPDRDVSGVESNDGSVALRLVHGENSFLFAGDLSSKVEDYLATLGDIESDVLKASHHGSRHSTSDMWLQTVRPGVVVISAGEGNSYGHPAPEVLERIRNAGARIMSTINHGTITILTDGARLEVR